MRRRTAPALALAALALAALGGAGRPAHAGPGDVLVLHEPIPPNPREDLAMHVLVEGLPAAIQTPSGIVGAPDPRAAPAATDPSYRPGSEHDVFVPDRDTRRPNVAAYDDPFTPATAPFKRLEAFDAVRADYELYVRDDHLVAMPLGPRATGNDEEFYGDVVVDLESDARIRVPSVGPGARIVRARLGLGSREIPLTVYRDGADNWFLQPRTPPARSGAALSTGARARLVMEIAVPRGALGGPIGDPEWAALALVPPLPDNVARDAALVRAAVGITRAMRPREVIGKLVRYFRSFTDSDDPPRGSRSLYLDLALSRKGVCRHRAFAFLVTAESAGIPTRLVMNEAHAWVEVHDATMWRRIDLGGAGVMTSAQRDPDRVPYAAPPDPFAWPQGAVGGDQMMADARAQAGGPGAGSAPGATAQGVRAAGASSSPASPSSTPPAASPSASPTATPPQRDDRPVSTVSLAVAAPDARRGGSLDVRGSVKVDREPCPHLAVELWLRGPSAGPPDPATPSKMLLVGTLATGEKGDFAGRVAVPASLTLGDYDLVARTAGDARCGASSP